TSAVAYVQRKPIFPNGRQKLLQRFQVFRFIQKGIGAEFIGALDNPLIKTIGQNDDRDADVAGITPNPLQNFKAVLYRELQIEENELWRRIGRAVCVLALPAQIERGFISIVDPMQV